MATIKTTQTSKSVTAFVKAVKDETKQNDSFEIIKIMEEVTGSEPKMWGPSIIGFGHYHYQYESGHEGDMPVAAFSPRSTSLVFYFSPQFDGRDALLQKLGKHKVGKCCVYVKKLADINIDVLKKLIKGSIKQTKSEYPD